MSNLRRMRGQLPLAGLVLIGALSAAGCGGGGGSFHSVLVAKLSAAGETDAAGAAGGSGAARITMNEETGRVCWTISLRGLSDKPISAHVQQGKAGKTGADAIPLGGTFARTGCLSAPQKSVSAIGRDPNGYYVNVYTLKYLHGAVRGQLAAITS